MAENSGANLTEVAYISRQVIKYGAVLLVTLMVGRFSITAFATYWKATHPPAPPPPTVGFGLLPTIPFPQQQDELKPKSYQLETATGGFPDMGDRAKVYLMLKSVPSLLDDEKAKKTAANFGFVFAPDPLDSDNYRFSKSQPLESTFEVNIRNSAFSLSTDFLSHPELLQNSEVPDQTAGINIVKTTLSSAELLPPDVATASGETVYLKALGNELSPALSFSDADYLEVNLQRTPLDGKFLSYTPEGKQGIIHAILSGAFSGKNSIVKMDYHYQTVDYTHVETYPIRTAKMAWQLLQSGSGYIADKGEYDTAVVRTVSLGYYESFQEQDYLQPVYVFEGDGGFMAFVGAIDSKNVQSSN